MAVALSAALLSACVPPETEKSLGRTFPETTRMGEIQAAGSLRIAVLPDDLPLGSLAGEPKGIAADLGRYVARTLGVEPEFVSAPSEQMLTLVSDPENTEVDLAFTNLALTEELVRDNVFTNPYFVAHQQLLVAEGSDVESTDDLRGERACAFYAGSEETAADLTKLGVSMAPADQQECPRLLARGRVEAVTAPTEALVNIAQQLEKRARQTYEIVGDELNTQAYSIATSRGAASFVTYINSVLHKAVEDGVMGRSYERWLSPYVEVQEPPGLSLEEAAAIFPTATDN